MRGSGWLVVAFCVGLCGCASSGSVRNGVSPLSYLSKVSELHSELDVGVSLALTPDQVACAGAVCAANSSFDIRVSQIGERLSLAAFGLYPELSERFDKFEFVVIDKDALGAVSTASGRVSVFRGLDQLALDDASLALVLSREMAHVIATHHEENMLTSFTVAVVAQIFMPMLNAVRGAASVAASSSMATSAASLVGSKAMRAGLRPGQLREAEELGLELARAGGYVTNDGVAGLQASLALIAKDDAWLSELRESVARLELMSAGMSLAAAGSHIVDAIVADVEEQASVARFNYLLESNPTAAGNRARQ
jgi:predicted Zn-dependent protease